MKKFKRTTMIKSVIYILLWLSAGIGSVQAQTPPPEGNHREDREKILQMRVSYVKDHLGLTEAENKKFLSVYEEHIRREENLRMKQRSLMRRMKQDYQQMTDADIEKTFAEEMALEQQIFDQKKAQFEQYKKLVPLKKMVELKLVERAFNKMLMEKLHGNRPGMPEPPEEK